MSAAADPAAAMDRIYRRQRVIYDLTRRHYLLGRDRLIAEDRILLQAAARAVLLSRRGSIADQVIRLEHPDRSAPHVPAPGAAPASSPATAKGATAEAAGLRPDLEFFNGLGGFAEGGREYVTILGPGQATPAPWLNVIANPTFGFQVSESGSGYTWAGNSRENQLTLATLDDKRRAIFYAAFGMIALLIAGADELFGSGAGTVFWIAAFAASIAAIWKIWVEANTY